MENMIVALIVGLAVYFFLRSLYRNFKSDGSEACGCTSACTGCDVVQSCTDADTRPERGA